MSNDRQEELSASAQAATSSDAAIADIMKGMNQRIQEHVASDQKKEARLDRAHEQGLFDRLAAAFRDRLARLKRESVSLDKPAFARNASHTTPLVPPPVGFPTTREGEAALQAWSGTSLETLRRARRPSPGYPAPADRRPRGPGPG